jgi:hypothetical protein
MSKPTIVLSATAAGLAVAFAALVSGSAAAAPLPSLTAQVKSAVAAPATEVRWRRHSWRRAYARGYGRGNSGCHIAGGYNRPNGCW